MQLEGYFVVLAPGDIRLKGHRIGIEAILYPYVQRGLSAEASAGEFETLSLEEVYATLLFYHRNRAQLDAYLPTGCAGGTRRGARRTPTRPCRHRGGG